MQTKSSCSALCAAAVVAVCACLGWACAGKLPELQAAAERGDARAQTALGRRYEEGKGVPQDSAAAARWLRLAAEQGDGEAQFLYGLLHREGHGVPQDYQEARYWILKSADGGNGEAQYLMGLMYQEGDGVTKDLVRAHMWYNLASANLTGEDRVAATRRRDWLSAVITPPELVQAQKLARDWLEEHPAQRR